MKKTIFTSLFILVFLMSACGSSPDMQDTDADPNTTDERQISLETLNTIEADINEAAFDDIWSYARDVDGKIDVSVHVDPAEMNYMLALNLEPIVEKLKEDIDLYGIELSEFEISDAFYKNGEKDSFLIWTSSDLETGQLVSTKEGIVRDATLLEVYEYCGYTPGEYKTLGKQ